MSNTHPVLLYPRQLEAGVENPLEWHKNCLWLVTYYVKEERWVAVRHCFLFALLFIAFGCLFFVPTIYRHCAQCPPLHPPLIAVVPPFPPLSPLVQAIAVSYGASFIHPFTASPFLFPHTPASNLASICPVCARPIIAWKRRGSFESGYCFLENIHNHLCQPLSPQLHFASH